jgi:hypothetical protein
MIKMSPRKITLSRMQYIGFGMDLAVILAQEYGQGPLNFKTGTDTLTEESQERFNRYYVEAEDIMVRLGFEWGAYSEC